MEELQKEIERLKQRIAELEKQLAEKPVNEVQTRIGTIRIK